MIWWWAAATAHPVGGRYVARTVVAELDPSLLRLTVRIDVPDALAEERHLDGDELRSGLSVRLDGLSITPTWTVEGPGVSGGDATFWHLETQLPIRNSAVSVTLSDGNLPDAPSFSRFHLSGDASWRLVSAEPVWTQGIDRSDTWLVTETAREWTVLALKSTPTTRAGRWLSGTPVWEGAAGAESLRSSLLHGSIASLLRVVLVIVPAKGRRLGWALATVAAVILTSGAGRAALATIAVALIARFHPGRVPDVAAVATGVVLACWSCVF